MLLQLTQSSAMPMEHALVVAARPRLSCRCWQLPMPLQSQEQLASADSRISMATPQESLYPLHSGRVQHIV